MIDLHTHILPKMDDGSASTDESIRMLEAEAALGVETVCLTSHYYPQEERPDKFLKRWRESFLRLREKMEGKTGLPEMIPGAEVYYFSGMRNVDELKELCIGQSRCILVEPPMTECTDRILDEIAGMGANLNLIPVIAHTDRYMRPYKDWDLPERILERNMVLSFNAEAFSSFRMRHEIRKLMKEVVPFLMGSDCHNMTDRKPDMDTAKKQIIKRYGEENLQKLKGFAESILKLRQN